MSSKTECTQDTAGPEHIHCTFSVKCLKAKQAGTKLIKLTSVKQALQSF